MIIRIIGKVLHQVFREIFHASSSSSSWSVLLKYAFGSHISMTVRSLGKPTISARSTVEDIFIAAATSKTEEQERERCFFYLEQCVDQG